MKRLAMAVCLLLAAATASAQFHSAGQIAPATPTTTDVVVYRYLAGCSPPVEDHRVTVSGFTITIQEIPWLDGGCRPIFVPVAVPIGRLPSGTYTLHYYTLNGTLAETLTFAVVDTAVPTVGEWGLAAVAASLAVCGALLLRR